LKYCQENGFQLPVVSFQLPVSSFQYIYLCEHLEPFKTLETGNWKLTSGNYSEEIYASIIASFIDCPAFASTPDRAASNGGTGCESGGS